MGKDTAYWLENCLWTRFPRLKADLKVDVAILGGGIIGVTTAKLLKESGFKVALIEAGRIVEGVSVGTTAKISVAPNIVYNDLISNLGREKAQLYADSNRESMKMIESIISDGNIDCDFQKLPLYIYSQSSENREKIEMEYHAAKSLGLPVSYTETMPSPFETGSAIKYDDQAQFHPRKYLLALSSDLNGGNSYVFEKTRVINVKNGAKKEVVTDQGSIFADSVVVATHKPVYDPDSVETHLHMERSYVIALYAKDEFPRSMFVEIDPTHTYRTTPTNKGKLIIVAGEHSPVNIEDKTKYYNRLINYAHDHLSVASVEYKWSSKDMATDDGIPLIGQTSEPGIYIATGMCFWGMINGTTAAIVNTDLINGKKNEYTDLFDPMRFLD